MKNILLAIAFIFMMALGASAQGGRTDGFFNYNEDITDRTSSVYSDVIFPNSHFTNHDQEGAPLGSGLIIFTALGAGYAVMRKRKK
ncbi:MAG: hypothetical protein IKS65_06055 [Bacteroidales bacterium]|nr:hypothetical protein [Bacteroidales bacterium]